MRLKKHTRKGKFGTELYIEDTEVGGFTAFFKELPSIVTEGKTIKEAQDNLWRATFDILKHHIQKLKNG